MVSLFKPGNKLVTGIFHSTALLLLILLSSSFLPGNKVPKEEKDSKDMVKAAEAFMNTLTPTLKQLVLYSTENDERANWYYVPKERNGVSFKVMNEAQLKAAKEMMKIVFSEEGFKKAEAVIEREDVIKILENRPHEDEYRDRTKYYITIFGEPSYKKHWGWRIEGHHLSYTFFWKNNKQVSGTPSFIGANPALDTTGKSKLKELLKTEEETARKLVKGLTPEQLEKATFARDVPEEIVTKGNSRKADLGKPVGLCYADMNVEQQQLMMELLEAYIYNHNKEFATEFMNRVKSRGLKNIYFGWVGGKERYQPHYYRIHGPSMIIEHVDTQNQANHIHTIVRDLEYDFGGSF